MTEPKSHDYTQRWWGKDYLIHTVNGNGMELSGWGTGIHAGDYLIMRNGTGTTRYRVDTIDYYRDPSDQWYASVTFAPRDAHEV